MVVKRVSQNCFSQQEQDALFGAVQILIDSLFDEYATVDAWETETILSTRLGKHLPRPYSAYYTPVFFKQFGMCVISVGWKLAQPKLTLPSSLAEQLAAWAILNEAKALLIRVPKENRESEMLPPFQPFLERYFPNTSFLRLFDLPCAEQETSPVATTTFRDASLCESWLHPFPGRTRVVHPYAGGSKYVGQAYKHWLTREKREILAAGIEVLIDEVFDDIVLAEESGITDFPLNALSWHLPSHFSSHYTPLLLKQFIVCILTVALKLAQPQRLLLSSIGEELAAWAIITAAKQQVEMEYDMEEKEGGETAAKYAFESVIDEIFEDVDFLFLFDRRYSGIHGSSVGQLLHMTSMAFADWLKPFTSGPEYLAHPYVFKP